MKKANISEVALKANVSKTTVSCYLNGRYDKMSEHTRERIQKAIDDLGYVPSLGAQGITKNKSMTIGVIMERIDMSNPYSMEFFLNMAQGITKILQAAGYRLIIIPDQSDGTESTIQYVMSASYGLCDGFLLMNIQENDKYIEALRAKGIPFVCFGYPSDRTVNNYVASNQGLGISEAVDMFFDEGVRKIILSVSHPAHVVSNQYLNGYREALERHGLDFDTNLVIGQGKLEGDSIYDELVRLLGNTEEKVGVILPFRQMECLLNAAKTIGKTLNKDFGFVVFNYFPLYRSDLRFGYILCQMNELGEKAAEMLLTAIDNESIESLEPTMFDPIFIKGDSCVL